MYILASSKFGDEQVLKETFISGELKAAWFGSCLSKDDDGSSISCSSHVLSEDHGIASNRLDLVKVAISIAERMCVVQVTSGAQQLMFHSEAEAYHLREV